MNYRRTLLSTVLLGLSFSAALSAGTWDNLQKQKLEALSRERGDAAGIVRLYEARALEYRQSKPGAFELALEETIKAADSSPEVAAHATFELVKKLRNRGDDERAARLESGLGFVDRWRIVGPFEDESKSGYDATYPPERKLEYEGTYMGKGHQVSWRPVPLKVKMGMVPLEQLIDPSTSVASYALALVHASRTTPCVIRGGYSEAYKLWVNGERVGGKKVYNGYAFDQYADPCTLTAGWNAILVKVCNGKGAWNFALRLTDASGRALEGVRVADDYKKVDEPLDKILAKNGAPPSHYSFFDPGAVLKKRAMDKKAVDEETLGLYLTQLRTYDPVDQKNLDFLRKAADDSHGKAAYWLALAKAETDGAKARMDLEEALKLNPANERALLEMADHFVGRGMPFAALAYLRRALKAAPDDPIAAASLANVQLDGNSEGYACRRLGELNTALPECNFIREAYISSLIQLKQEDRALDLELKVMQERKNERWAWTRVIQRLTDVGKEKEALGLYSEMEKRFPLSCSIYFKHASYLLKLNRVSEAASVIGPVLEWAPDWPSGHELYGDALEAMGKEQKALSEYRTALLLKPQDEDLKRKVAFIGPEKKGFEEAYRIAESDVPSAEGDQKGEQAIVLLSNEVVKVQPNGLASRYVQRVVKVLQRGAVRPLSYFSIPFDPDRQEVRVLQAYILKPDGSKVHANIGYTDWISNPSYRMYYRNRNLVLSFPSLNEGDEIWTEFKVSDVGEANEYGKYFGDITLFGGPLKIVEKHYTLILPKSFPLYMHEEKMSSEPMVLTVGDETVYRWIMRNLPRLKREPGMPGMTEVVPYLHISTFNTWDAMGKWYADFIGDQWALTPEMKEKVKELTAGLKTRKEKVAAIHKWVVQKTRYVGLEFGVHGYKPYKVSKVYTRRFGDCKDKATLMASMLREAGFDAAIVLVRTADQGELNPKPASLAVFNHAICYVPELKLFLDGTAEYSSLTELPYQDQGVWVLVVWPDGRTKRMKTPVDKVGDDTFKALYKLKIQNGSKSAPVEAKISITGQECARIRSRYQDSDKVAETLQQDLSNNFPATVISSASAGDVSALKDPVVLNFSGKLGQVVRPDGEGFISVPTWMGALAFSAGLASLSKRVYPEQIEYPFSQEYKIRYRLPEGARVVPLSQLKVNTRFGSVIRKIHVRKGSVTVTTNISVTVTKVMPKDYGDFKAFCLQADQAGRERLRIELAGGKS